MNLNYYSLLEWGYWNTPPCLTTSTKPVITNTVVNKAMASKITSIAILTTLIILPFLSSSDHLLLIPGISKTKPTTKILINPARTKSDILPPLKEVGASCSMTLMSQA